MAWFATRTSKTAVARFLRVGWATVGQIITWVMADAGAAAGDRLVGVTRSWRSSSPGPAANTARRST